MTFFTKRKSFWVAAVLVAAGALFVIRSSALRSMDSAEGPAPAASANAGGTVSFLMEQQWLIRLKLARVEAATLAPQIVSTGRIIPAPRNHALVGPPVGGIITGRPLPRLGQDVRQGEQIAVLTQTPTAAESAQIRMETVRIEAERRRLAEARVEAEARRDFAHSELERAERLFEQKAYSRRQVESAEADYRTAEAALAAINAQQDALTMPETAAIYEVRAPISGTVVRVEKRFGERVAPGEAILEIVDMETVWVEAPIFETDLGRIGEDPRAIFTTPTFGDREFQSRAVIDAGDVIDEDTRAAMFVFEVPNPGRALRIGMQANLRLDTKEETRTLLVPKEAVLDNEGRKIVYVLLSGETFERRNVTLGDEYGDRVAILSGLEEGERVVTQGAYQLKLQELAPADPGAHTHEV